MPFAAEAKDAAAPKCTKICTAKSQPCGNACISKKLECHKPPGTACAAK